MSHQEASPPSQPSQPHRFSPSVHNHNKQKHHRRHDHRRHFDTRKAGGLGPQSVGQLIQISQSPDSHAIVESWLERVPVPALPSRPVSQESRQYMIRDDGHPHRQSSGILDSHRQVERESRAWRPRHIPFAQEHSPSGLPLTQDYERKHKRTKLMADDSSLLDYYDIARDKGPQGTRDPFYEYQASSRCKPPHELPPESCSVDVTAFEKRPRHKTRLDKYDTKKQEAPGRKHMTPEPGEDSQKRSRSRKKTKHIATGKNVMNNFTSQAVHPSLRPGLFKNQRVSKKHPVTDLSFSDMRLLKHKEREAPSQWEIPNSRHHRESRELEQISSFFLPSCQKNKTNNRKRTPCQDEQPKPLPGDGSFITTLSSPTELVHGHQQHHLLSQTSWPGVINPGSNPGSHSKSPVATTYLTWSTSQYSPKAKRRSFSGGSNARTDPTKSPTPDSTKRALLATGVYRNTGIRPYDPPDDDRSENRGRPATSSDDIESGNRRELLQTDEERSNTITPIPTIFEQRWKTILPPEWRLSGSPGSPGFPVSPATKGQQDKAKSVSLGPWRSLGQGVHQGGKIGQPQDNDGVDEDATTPFQASGKIADDNAISVQDRASVTSRELMPPPPIPPPRQNRETCSNLVEPGFDKTRCKERPEISDSFASSASSSRQRQPQESRGDLNAILSPLDSVSWIPQAVTSTITSLDRDRAQSRLSTRSTIYKGQCEEQESQQALHRTPPPLTPPPETIAEFIRRIENEAEYKTLAYDENCIQEPTEQMDCQQSFPSTECQHHDDMQAQSPRKSEGCHFVAPANGIDIFASAEYVPYHKYEGLGIGAVGTPGTLSAEGPTVEADEILDMSMFWRPNQFARF
ncbi:hypothetical protein GGS20DRAFT_589792 [Poronia punctata]|nr:hypothetical protein GGS20DRAFT_589792 [Poronia punctata]